MSGSSDQSDRGTALNENDILSPTSRPSKTINNNLHSPVLSNTSAMSPNTEISQYRSYLRTIHDRMQETTVLGESLVSAELELQLYLQNLKNSNTNAISLHEAFDNEQEKKSQELQEKIKTLMKTSEKIMNETFGIVRNDPSSSTLVCLARKYKRSFIF